MGLCFVTQKGFDELLNLKEKVLKNLKEYPSLNKIDILWVKIFVNYITLESKDIDLRLQKGLLDEVQIMIDM